MCNADEYNCNCSHCLYDYFVFVFFFVHFFLFLYYLCSKYSDIAGIWGMGMLKLNPMIGLSSTDQLPYFSHLILWWNPWIFSKIPCNESNSSYWTGLKRSFHSVVLTILRKWKQADKEAVTDDVTCKRYKIYIALLIAHSYQRSEIIFNKYIWKPNKIRNEELQKMQTKANLFFVWKKVVDLV